MYPVIIFTYNRLHHLKECIKSLKKNHSFLKSKIFIIQDKLMKLDLKISQKYKSIYKLLPSTFKVITRKKNFGLKKDIMDGISLILKKYNKVIVCEDDLIFHKHFLNYMNFMLKKYLKNMNISSISAFSYALKKQFKLLSEEYSLALTSSWGWAINKEHWREFLKFQLIKYKKILFKNKKMQYHFDYDGAQSHTFWLKKNRDNKISSWNIEWEFSNFIRKRYTIYPKKTYVENRGFDESGVHCAKSNYQFQLIDNNFKFKKNKNEINEKIFY